MRQLTTIALFCIALLLSGCSYRPLYGAGNDGKGVAVAMSGITVEEQKTRAGQLVRNNLLSSLGTRGSGALVLRLLPDEKSLQLSANSTTRLERHRYNLKIGYELVDGQTGSVLTRGASFSNVSYDTVEQPIADLRAAENARERASREVAEDIRLRLAAHFARAP
jgi:LPS-assembly lipoprotein